MRLYKDMRMRDKGGGQWGRREAGVDQHISCLKVTIGNWLE